MVKKMKLNVDMLKKLILEVLDEGRREKDWIQQQPKEEQGQWLSAEQKGLKLSDLAWIKKFKGSESIENSVKLVLAFRKPEVQKKLKDNGFATDLSKKTYRSIDDLKKIIKDIAASQETKLSKEDIFSDPNHVMHVMSVGDWEMYMPITREGSISCDISGKETTWCTTKSKGQNLFYSYANSLDEDIVLFYLIDHSRTPNIEEGTDLDARMSLGYLDGEVVLDGEDGGLSVNAANEGITFEYLEDVLGEKLANNIEMYVEWGVDWLEGQRPTREYLKKAAKNLFFLKKIIKDYGKEERLDFVTELPRDEMSPEVAKYVSKIKQSS